ncbi:MAG: hypothetical protein ACK4IX_00875 [Candidatus Sericytochromatia bacterium]
MFIKLDGEPEVYLDMEDKKVVEYYRFTSSPKYKILNVGENNISIERFNLEMKKDNESSFVSFILHIEDINKESLDLILKFYNSKPENFEINDKKEFNIFLKLKEYYLDKLVINKSKREKSIFNILDAEQKVTVLNLSNYELEEVL